MSLQYYACYITLRELTEENKTEVGKTQALTLLPTGKGGGGGRIFIPHHQASTQNPLSIFILNSMTSC